MSKRELDNVATKKQVEQVLEKIENLEEKQTTTDAELERFKTNYLIQDK